MAKRKMLFCAQFGDTGTAGAHGGEEAETAHDLMERVRLVLLALLALHEPRLRHPTYHKYAQTKQIWRLG